MAQKNTEHVYTVPWNSIADVARQIEQPYGFVLRERYLSGLSCEQISEKYVLGVEFVVKDLHKAQKLFASAHLTADMLTEPEDHLLYLPAIDLVLDDGVASISYLQRKLKVGYFRAARLLDQMEADGIVGHRNGGKPRRILIGKHKTCP
ncbi:MAG TPA: DNA translocase FtsK [Flavobacteriales bacterium]|nr:DNA translocase FtsK [Flavobacteriales bacterium]